MSSATRDASGLLRLQTSADGRSGWTFVTEPKISHGPAYEVRIVPGTGMMGMFAARDIAAGERLISEAPLARWAVRAGSSREERIRSFAETVVDFTPQQTAKLLALSEAGHFSKVKGKRTLMGTWLTNALPINYEDGQGGSSSSGADHEEEAAVFETICRINHACSPSCHHEWNPALGTETVHALKSIPRGSELSISYLMPAGRTRAERQERLSRQFGFECTCSLCSLAGEALARSDACQRAIGDVSEPPRGLALPELLKRLQIRLAFMAKEGMPDVWARPLLVSAMVQSVQDASAEGRQRSHQLADRASACVKLSTGDDHPAYQTVSTFISVVEKFESEHGGQAGLAAALAGGQQGVGSAASAASTERAAAASTSRRKKK